MNNDLNDSQLESLLRGLAPAAASPSLTQRVDEELKLDMSWLSTSHRKPHRTPKWITSAGWAAMGAAAAIAVMSYLPTQQSSIQGIAAVAPAVLPVSTLREVDDLHDSSIHHSLVAEKRALVVSRELGTWVDPRYSAQMAVDYPSQQAFMQNVSFIK
jgi:hypothetical protein